MTHQRRISDAIGHPLRKAPAGDRDPARFEPRPHYVGQPRRWRDRQTHLPQSLAIACAAAGLADREAGLFRIMWKYSLLLLAIMILPAVLQPYVVPGVVPQDVPGLSP
ncbi:MAG: hypothetical protein ABR910_13070 [Acidobacteriaceae bacterium]